VQSLIAMEPSKVKHAICKQSCQAGQPCYLHLHGASSWVRGTTERPAVYAAKSAPGLVMASGAPLLSYGTQVESRNHPRAFRT
jgi:hypothetical protein